MFESFRNISNAIISSRKSLSHPNFFIDTNEKNTKEAVSELRRNPKSFCYRSQSRILEGEGEPIVAIKQTAWGVELLASWGVHKHSLFSIRLPLNESCEKSLPTIGDWPKFSAHGYLISFHHTASDNLKLNKGIKAKISRLSKDKLTVMIEAFTIFQTENGSWSVQPELSPTSSTKHSDYRSSIFDDEFVLPKRATLRK